MKIETTAIMPYEKHTWRRFAAIQKYHQPGTPITKTKSGHWRLHLGNEIEPTPPQGVLEAHGTIRNGRQTITVITT